MRRILVTGAGGFIGHHLVTLLKSRGDHVIGVDQKLPVFGPSLADCFVLHDIRETTPAFRALFEEISDVYALAADMGGMGFISRDHATIMRNNTMIDLNTLEAARLAGVKRYLFTSSACVYPQHLQIDKEVTPLAEEMAYPADPQGGYGWQKLYTEKLCQYYCEEHRVDARIARLHNVYGPLGVWQGGREKAPAALCRKVAIAALTGRTAIEIWGDGEQTRSFCYVDDCTSGLVRLMNSGYPQPVNIGRDDKLSINALADLVMNVAGVRLEKIHTPGPEGVRGRNSDNTRAREVLEWVPEVGIERGIATTYRWIYEQVDAWRRNGASALS